MGKAVAKVAWVLFLIGVVNGMACLAGAVVVGGGADSRKPGETRYYVASHGHRTEVSAVAWHYISLHASTMLITTPLGILGGIVLVSQRSLKPGKPTETIRN